LEGFEKHARDTLLEEKVLYRTLKRIWNPYLVNRTFYPKKWFYIEAFWSSTYEAGDGTISGSK